MSNPSEPFAVVPMAELTAVHKGCGPAAVLTYCALRSFNDPKRPGRCWPGQKALAERAGLAVSTVRTHLAKMESAGLIARAHRCRKDGRGRTTDAYSFTRPNAGSIALGQARPTAEVTHDLPPQVERTYRRKSSRGTFIRTSEVTKNPPPAPESAAPAEQADSLDKLGTAAVAFFEKLKAERPGQEAKTQQRLPEWIATYGTHHVTRALGILGKEVWTADNPRTIPGIIPTRLGELTKEAPSGWAGCGCVECRDQQADEEAERAANAIVDRAMRVTRGLALAKSWLACPAAPDAFWIAVEAALPAHGAQIMEAADAGDARPAIRAVLPETDALVVYRQRLEREANEARMAEAQRQADAERERRDAERERLAAEAEAEAAAEKVRKERERAERDKAMVELRQHIARKEAERLAVVTDR